MTHGVGCEHNSYGPILLLPRGSGVPRGFDSTSVGMLVIFIPSGSISVVGGRSYPVGIRLNPLAMPIC